MESAVLIGVISTHAHLTALCRQVGQVAGLKIMVYEGALESAEPGLRYFEDKGVEVIVSTRGNSIFIREQTAIPVVSVPENKFDIFYPLAKAAKRYDRKLRLFVYRQAPVDFADIFELLGFEPNVVVFNHANHLEGILEELQGTDEVVIGGGFVCQVASSLGFITEQVTISKESFLNALESARGLALARRTERKENLRLKAILDCSYEGIVATDERGIITLFNRGAENIFNTKAKEVLGRHCSEALPSAKLQDGLVTQEPIIGEIAQVGNAKLVVNRVPIISGEEISGTVASFQGVQSIQDVEEKIRKELAIKTQDIRYNFADIRGHSRAIYLAVEQAKKYAGTEETILILGESGTGKELFAQSIHGVSHRKHKTFVAVNCAAIPATLLESELFGYSEGSFTGARKGGKAGLFELAHGGTLFLDEIGEMPLEVQAKLLRVIQEKEVRRIGGDRVVRVDVRIIAATHRDLRELVTAGKFRNDLFYRLDVLHLNVPSLWERRDDLPYLITEILNKCSEASVRQKKIITSIITARNDYSWPGNVRELENIVRRLAVLIKGLSESEALKQGEEMFEQHCGTQVSVSSARSTSSIQVEVEGTLKEIIINVEKQIIRHTLRHSGGDHGKAASALGIGRTTLWRKLGDDHGKAGKVARVNERKDRIPRVSRFNRKFEVL